MVKPRNTLQQQHRFEDTTNSQPLPCSTTLAVQVHSHTSFKTSCACILMFSRVSLAWLRCARCAGNLTGTPPHTPRCIWIDMGIGGTWDQQFEGVWREPLRQRHLGEQKANITATIPRGLRTSCADVITHHLGGSKLPTQQ